MWMSMREQMAWAEASRVANILVPEKTDALAYWLATELIFEAIRIHSGFLGSMRTRL